MIDSSAIMQSGRAIHRPAGGNKVKTVYTIGLSNKTRKGEIKIGFTKRSYADHLAGFIRRVFHVKAWSIINNIYTDAEIAEIKAAFRKAQQRPLDQNDLKVWHWKE